MPAIVNDDEVSTRKSTPLSERDLRDLELIKSAPEYAGRSEASILREMLQRGVAAARAELMETGYAAIAAEQAQELEQRRAVARRRRPAWVAVP